MASANEKNNAVGTTTGQAANPDSPDVVMNQKSAETSAASSYVFPGDLGSLYFEMNFVEFQPGGGNETPKDSTSLHVALPIPAQITDEQGITYNEAELGITGKVMASTVGGAAGNLRNAAADERGRAIVSGMKEGWQKLQAGGGEVAKAGMLVAARKGIEMGASVVGALGGGDANAGLALGLGTQLNPHLALIFQGVPLRTYSFSWKLAPQSREENQVLMDMFKMIKARIHPEASFAQLKFPDQVDLAFKGSDHLGTHGEYIFKRAAVTSINVDYAPDGPSFFAETGNPTQIGVTMGFQETEIHSRQDYA